MSGVNDTFEEGNTAAEIELDELNQGKAEKKEYELDEGENKKFTTIQASMAISSCILGAGIVSIPYGMIVNGIWIGIASHVVLIIFMLFCTYMYITARDMF